MILRTNTATHLGQAIGSVRQLRGLEELAFLDQLQPAGNVVVDRAPPLAVGIAATQVMACLKRGGLWIKLTIDFPVDTNLGRGRRRILPRYLRNCIELGIHALGTGCAAPADDDKHQKSNVTP